MNENSPIMTSKYDIVQRKTDEIWMKQKQWTENI